MTLVQSYVSIVNPDGTTYLLEPEWAAVAAGGSFYVDTMTLPATGSYTLVVDAFEWRTGSVTLTLNDVPADVAGAISPGGGAVPITISTPGQNAVLTFTGTASQKVSLRITSSTIAQSYVSIRRPDGVPNLLAPQWTTGATAFFDTMTLPVGGTYTIVIDPHQVNVGSMTLTLYDTTADATAALTINGGSVTMTIATPGENGVATFSGTAGQAARVRLTANPVGSVTLTLVNPSGGTVTSGTGSAAFNLSPVTLSATGDYQVRVNPAGANTGTLTLSVTSP